MTPENFEIKMNELRAIEQRMRFYNNKTAISKVVADQRRAKSLYDQLADAISELKGPTSLPWQEPQ